MAAHIIAAVRVVSVLDQFEGPGRTMDAIRRAIGPIPPPEDAFGPIRWLAREAKSHSHDSKWGYLIFWGDLVDWTDSEAIRAWWMSVLGALSNLEHVGVNQGVIQVETDGQCAWTMDHHQVFQETAELVGE